jgi:cytochrome P450
MRTSSGRAGSETGARPSGTTPTGVGPSQSSGPLYWDPYDIELRRDPYDTWSRLRDQAPVYRNDAHDFWALSRFADVDHAHRRPEVFSSAHGTVLELMTPEPTGGSMMIFQDPPSHTRLRALVSRAFTPRRVAGMEEGVRRICCELLDAQKGHTSFDYVANFSALLPARVIASLLGVPEADREEIRELIDRVLMIEDDSGMVNDASANAILTIHQYVQDQLRERRSHPRDDLMTELVTAEVSTEDGENRRLTNGEGADFAVLIVSAGTETVARLLGWACLLLGRHADQRAQLAEDPALVPNAVEELLRIEAPSPVQGRWTTADVELHGVVIPAGSKVLLLTGSAGRDERAYPDPDRLDVCRHFDRHMSFGYGIHFCLGAALARLEGRIGIEETLKRYPTWEVDEERAVALHTSTVRGHSHMPISVKSGNR